MRKAARIPILFLSACTLIIFGCATRDDLSPVKRELPAGGQTMSNEIQAMENMIRKLNEEVAGIKQQLEKSDATIDSLRRGQAEGGATITEIRDHIQQVRGSIEVLRKDITTQTTRSSKREEEAKDFRERLESVSFKINFIENFIGVGKKAETAEPLDKGKPPAPAARETAPAKISKTDRDVAYAAAYDIFKEGKYERARQDFQNFLKQFPDSEYSDNALFWIAESFYFENRFDKAIPEYEKVIKNYPDGNKFSHALLKLGISYAALGDKAKARTILQQVIKDFPNTAQARTARTKLSEVK